MKTQVQCLWTDFFVQPPETRRLRKNLQNGSAYQIRYVIVVIFKFSRVSVQVSLPKSQEDSDPIKYRKVLVSTLLYAFTTFAECIGTDCK
jgi:hypothetical protein